MKKLVLTLALGFGMSTAIFAQGNVPENIKSSFNDTYSDAKNVEWKAKDDGYFATYEMEGEKQWIKYKADGNVEMQGQEIEVNELPQGVRNAINQQYANRSIEKVKTVDRDSRMYYMVKLEGDDEDLKVLFKPDGSVLKEKDKDERKN